MTAKPTLYLPVVLLALCAALADANWYLQPRRAAAWVTVVILLLGLTFALVLLPRRVIDDVKRRRVEDQIGSGVVFAGLILLISLSLKLATALGARGETDLTWRAIMAVVGAFLVFTGNTIPKTLTPLSSMHCDAARAQTVQRLAGWTGVLTGLAFLIAWLVLPTGAAESVSFVLLPSGMLLVAAQAFWLRRTRQRAT